MTNSWEPTRGDEPTVAWPDPSTAPPADAKRPYRKGIAIGFAAAIVAVPVGIAAYFGITHYLNSRPFTLTGTLVLNGGDNVTTGTGCNGTGGYGDIGPGSTMTVSDEANTLLAKGALENGSGESGWCSWPFRITDVPGGKKFYKIEVSHRGQVNYTESEARAGIQLQLGDASESSTTSTRSASPPPPAAPPAAAPPIPSAKTLKPSDGYVYIVTKSGKTYCQITTFEVDCQAPFTDTPFVNGVRANGVRFTADGKAEWVSGDLGDIPVVSIDYDTYRALSWTIVASHVGTTFTHTNGRSIFISLDSVKTS